MAGEWLGVMTRFFFSPANTVNECIVLAVKFVFIVNVCFGSVVFFPFEFYEKILSLRTL